MSKPKGLFNEQYRLKEIHKQKDPNAIVNVNVLDKVSERIIDLSETYSIFFIAVCGAAATGKSTFSINLSKYIESKNPKKKVVVIPLDSFILNRSERQRLGILGYDPRSQDIDAAQQSIERLKNGKKIYIEPYNHTTGTKVKSGSIEVLPSDIVIIDGSHSFHDKLSKYIGLKIFINGQRRVLKELRFITEINSRGYTPTEAFRHSEKEYLFYKRFVAQYKSSSDLIIKVGYNWDYKI